MGVGMGRHGGKYDKIRRLAHRLSHNGRERDDGGWVVGYRQRLALLVCMYIPDLIGSCPVPVALLALCFYVLLLLDFL